MLVLKDKTEQVFLLTALAALVVWFIAAKIPTPPTTM
jgi:hypothetical protein